MKNIFLHICCAPCSVYPVSALKTETAITGFFYNPNIQPSREYVKRKETVEQFASKTKLDVQFTGYEMERFFEKIASFGKERCGGCYELRLRRTATEARKQGYGWFSSTLLYSRRQNHELIREIGDMVAREEKIGFLYRDFRTGWEKGIEGSKEMGLYRQNYCGCVFSERERFCP